MTFQPTEWKRYKMSNPDYRKRAREYEREYTRKRMASDPDFARYRRGVSIMRNYGITLEQYDQMLHEQHGVCAVCGKISTDGKPLHVDHDHTTGKVRALLCNKCNLIEGQCRGDSTQLRKLADYIDQHRNPELSYEEALQKWEDNKEFNKALNNPLPIVSIPTEDQLVEDNNIETSTQTLME